MQQEPTSSETMLASFRSDLRYFQGPDADDGSATYTVFDPLNSEYFKISWSEMAIIRNHQKGMSANELAKKVNANSTLNLNDQHILHFFKQAEAQNLLAMVYSSEKIQNDYEKKKTGWCLNFLLNYLFFKIPLFYPDDFLARTYRWIAPLFTLKALIFYLFIAFTGLITFFLHWDAFLSTFPYFFNLEGMLAYALAISFVKILHELSHAYTAKKYGLHVPSMGMAILLLFPVLYTDATDAWKLPHKIKRIAISSAGIIAELLMAGLATLGWAYTSSGIMNSLFFVIASVNWINTLLINLNPALRFDGYYMLSDWMKIENLQSRSFSLLRYVFYKLCIGLSLLNPESELPFRKQCYMVIYSIYVLIYRLFIYTVIALFVYYKFTKAIGILLFFIEILIFFIWPVVYELRVLYRLKSLITWNKRLIVSSILTLLMICWATIPLPHHHSFNGITVPAERQMLYAQRAGKISKFHLERASAVSKGDPLLIIDAMPLNFQKRIQEKQKEIIQKKLEIIAEHEALQSFYLEKQAELSKTEAEVQSLNEQIEQNTLSALYTGMTYDINPFLRQGVYVAENEYLGSVGTKKVALECFVPENQLTRIKIGDRGFFYSFAGDPPQEYVITRIAPVRTRRLPYAQLSSIHQGNIPTQSSLELNGSYYALRAELYPIELKNGILGSVEASRFDLSKPVQYDNMGPVSKVESRELSFEPKSNASTHLGITSHEADNTPFGLTGYFVLGGPWSSFLGDLARSVMANLIEESQID